VLAKRFGYARLPETGSTLAGEATWRRAWRLVQLIDHADLFVALTRGSRWFNEQADVQGAWPATGPFLAVTFHWGAGLGSLGHLANAGHRARFLSGRFGDADFGNDAWRVRYVKLRIRAIERVTGAPVIYTGGASSHIEDAFARGTCVVALCDVPPSAGRSTINASLNGLQLRMPLGLARLACARRIPVVSYVAGVDRATGRRYLAIDEARIFSDPASLAAALAARLGTQLERDAAAWHMWPYAADLLS
jgi:phosphatidylinositol dimannoside acyltransferase